MAGLGLDGNLSGKYINLFLDDNHSHGADDHDDDLLQDELQCSPHVGWRVGTPLDAL